MQRRRLLQATAALGAGLTLSALRSAWAAGAERPPPGLHHVRGEVWVNGRPASPGTPIKPGDQIRTGAASEAIYIVGNDAWLQRDHSQVTLNAAGVKAGLRILNGKLLSVFGKGDKSLETSTATIGIRGTGCYIEAEAERVYFCLCYGVADIVSHHRPSVRETIRTRHHDQPLYLLANGDKTLVPASVQNHTDAELILLEALVGRVPPFHGQPEQHGDY